ncbi:PPOX class F420-dependent oxidoreductase [Nocardia mangyaensis]|uniref:PPOX class F420-dependent oxidoreductase n=1 Tax=Nocardia mangyaensis TaxID=2213200 RepID=UPI0026775AAE|nr:PPOX class F420-dependent oxidoreductase [Nocardia mangyaensis]MDO3648047.1 PPOX class F420-dependent oxidoreductase [Nocardia mangyaensis]
MSASLTAEQIAYLSTQKLGRLATVRADGTPQNNPVGFRYNADLGTIDIAGWNLAASKKFRNLATNPHVSFVVDDIASVQPWRVRCVEIRGTAQALTEAESYMSEKPDALIRIHPTKIIAFGLTPESPQT